MSRFNLLSQEEEILYAPADCFEPYPDHKIRLKLHTGEKYQQLKESIMNNGVIEPVIVMHSENRGKFTIIAGHNRVNICKKLNIEVPYYLKTDLTKEQADLICIETNLLNRQHDELLPSELANILYTRNEILKHQGRRTDLALDQVGLKSNTKDQIGLKSHTVEKIGREFKLSPSNVKRYIRLVKLNVDLLNLVDNNTIPINAGVEVSFLKPYEQAELYNYIITNNYKLSLNTAKTLKEMSNQTEDNIDIPLAINQINETKNKQAKQISLSINEIKKYVPSHDMTNLYDIIIEALKLYYQNKK